ncbi:MAG: hypothetical protein DWQ05_01860 [Calditrichaeota bacterium]|nr:MAG: hypothetical protein DWQ05_01860 [Calditrichota bacterium]
MASTRFYFLILLFLVALNYRSAASTNTDSDKVYSENIREVRVRFGMTLGNILRKNDIPRLQIQPLLNAFSSVYNPRKIRAGEKLQLKFDADGQFSALYYRPTPDRKVNIFADSSGNFIAHLDTLPIIVKEKLLVGTIETTLYEAILQAGESPELIMAFSDIFQWDIDFFIDPRVGDSFGILYQKKSVIDPESGLPTFLQYGDILAAAYAQKDTTLIAFGNPVENGLLLYYDENGKSFQKTFLKSPLNYRRISSYFSRSRFHTIFKRRRAHTGVDFAARTGTPVVSSADGTVIFKGWNGGYGRCVKISHKNGSYVTLYGHLSRYANLRVGQKISQNHLVGYVGQSGNATGPHLHYTMYYNKKAIDPLKIRPLAGKPLQASQLPEFNLLKETLLQKLGLGTHKNFEAILMAKEVSAR